MQEDLLRILVASGIPVVLVLVTGRPYAIGPVAGELAGVVQALFPGDEGGGTIAGCCPGGWCPAASCRCRGLFLLCGPERVVGPDRVLDTPAEVRVQ